ncbi:hypothetical protein MPTK1_3g24980 [Marchantia polymorpha subsp. ruderalis]|uniref:WRC domain-containing protein n=2 Tax=Marchantia polymorpha TaxID=3197 RepID=A0A176W8H7_MARPO|nr:hypothetical protein AXG93_2446s1040 [Marchantia polymorpha subsp. ruderalis]PTQ32296.1 hypothetical protein MARPO_0100s0011 [Marchantia polymorpha]BBN06919.1 hypothetical protein Mp_3g24980 [Marchantia polymorpha subsp. ruderalis]|eukprot:PTQ32296.1 hypothetical protein MARPO_0100s0011 [Marchantia polymorpha]
MSPRKTSSPPKKVVCHNESKESEDKPSLEQDSASTKDDSVAELPIPWRTSRRLQEATYRLIQERDGGHAINSVAASKHKHSQGFPSQVGKSSKRELSTSDSDAEGSELTDERKEEKKPAAEPRKKRKSVHFSDPLVVYIDDKKQSAASPSKTSPRKSEQGDVAQPTANSPPKQIMSCFDLLCNHVGPKGWRCYRSCTEGTSFCNYHQTSNASIVRISVCT